MEVGKKMAKFPTYEEMGKKVAEEALDGYIYNGKTLREWIDVLVHTKWIPVSERLPKYGKEVLTCSNDGFIEIQSIENDVWDEYNYWENQNGDRSDFDEVIAWQPLPEPYKAESEDSNEDT